jgi:hypothetical protein
MRKRGALSAEARAKIAAAQKKRWAKARDGLDELPRPLSGHRGGSPKLP